MIKSVKFKSEAKSASQIYLPRTTVFQGSPSCKFAELAESDTPRNTVVLP